MTGVPFSFPVDVTSLPPKGRDYKITAKPEDRAAVARALGVESVENLSAQLALIPGAGGSVAVSGKLSADVIQACVVTLAPVPGHIDETITRRFVADVAPKAKSAEKRKEKDKEASPEPDGWVDPNAEVTDPLIDNIVDLGEVVTEQLALALNPYPRAPGATFSATAAGEGTASPFAALAALKVGKSTPRRGGAKSAGSGKKSRSKGKTGG